MSREIDEIINFVESESKNKEIRRIKEVKLPEEVLKFVKKYERVCNDRDRFLWKWGIKLVSSKDEGFMFSTVPEKDVQKIGNLKVIFTILITILDDIADVKKDEELLKSAMLIPLKRVRGVYQSVRNKNEKEILEFVEEIWEYVLKELKELPRFDEFERIFLYDVEQEFNSFYHSLIVNTNPSLINLTETRKYGSHNMVFMLTQT